jgi:allantoin racemase
MRLLLVNANTTEAVTEAVVREGKRCASPGVEIVGVTARFGANIVTAHPENVLAAHAALDLLAAHHRGFDAAILAISFDSGLFAARELLPIPVIGMTEAALHTACLLARRFGVITFGHASTLLYRDLFASYGLAERIAAVRTIELASIKTYLATENLHDAIVSEARALQDTAGVNVVVICGAALAGIAHALQPRVSSATLLDGIGCAVRQAEALLKMGLPHSGLPRAGLVRSTTISGVGPDLAQLFKQGGG